VPQPGIATLPRLSFPTRKGQILKPGGKHGEKPQRGAGTPTVAVTGMGGAGVPWAAAGDARPRGRRRQAHSEDSEPRSRSG